MLLVENKGKSLEKEDKTMRKIFFLHGLYFAVIISAVLLFSQNYFTQGQFALIGFAIIIPGCILWCYTDRVANTEELYCNALMFVQKGMFPNRINAKKFINDQTGSESQQVLISLVKFPEPYVVEYYDENGYTKRSGYQILDSNRIVFKSGDGQSISITVENMTTEKDVESLREKKIKDEYDFIAMLDHNLGMVVNYGGQLNRFKIAN